MPEDLFPAADPKPKRPRARVMTPQEVVETAPTPAAEPTPEATTELGGALVTMAVANALQTFTSPENFSALTAKMREELARETFDPTTAKGRKYIAKRAMDVRRAKARLDDARNELLNGARATIKSVNASWSGMEEELNALAVEVRRPADEWEAVELVRVTTCNSVLDAFRHAAFIAEDDTSESVRARGELAYDTVLDPAVFGDMLADAETAKATAIETLGRAFNRLKKAEDDAARLAALEAAEAERQRVEAERLAAEVEAQRLRDEAAEKADRVMREAEAQRLSEIAAQVAEAERIQRAKDEAAQAERNRLTAEREAEMLAEQERHALELAAAREEAAAAKRAQEQETARLAEIQRQRDAADAVERERVAAEAAAQAKRDKDRNHRTACKKEAKEALVGLGLSEADAVKVVLALIGGEVPHSVWSF